MEELNATPALSQSGFQEYKNELEKLKESIQQIRQVIKDAPPNGSNKFLLLRSYLLTSVNIVEDITILLDALRLSMLEGMVRMFLENYAEYYQIASKFNDEIEINREINYIFFKQIGNEISSFLRIKESEFFDSDNIKKTIKQSIKLFLQARFPGESSCLKESSDESFIESARAIVSKISNNPNLIDKKRIELSKTHGGSDFVKVAVDANPIWGPSGYDGSELLYGILSETIHANWLATFCHSKEDGCFDREIDYPRAASLMGLMTLSLEYMRVLWFQCLIDN